MIETNTQEEIRSVRKQERIDKKDCKNRKKTEIKLDNLKISNDIKFNIDAQNIELINIRKNIKLNDSNKSKIEKEILKKISKYNVDLLKLDDDFMTRNVIRTQMCPKIVLKNKECKYDECTFAHNEDELRTPKCISHIYGICSYGNRCIHDHSESELPKIPVKPEEDLLLYGLNIEILSLIGEYLPSTIEDFPLTKLTIEDFPLTKLTIEDFPVTKFTIEDFPLLSCL